MASKEGSLPRTGWNHSLVSNSSNIRDTTFPIAASRDFLRMKIKINIELYLHCVN